VAPGLLKAQSRPARYPISFSTLGCPAWSWKTILDNADTLGYAGIELRGIAGEMDSTKVPELSGTRLAATRKDLAALGLVVSDLGASANMHQKDQAARQQQFDEGRRFIDLAQAMGVKYVRMFGDRFPEGEPRDDVLKRVVEGFQVMAEHAKPGGADRRYTLLGAGEVPVAEQVKVLAAGGYQGYYSFEWEKQPGIEEPEVAFPHYAKTMAAYLAAAGVKAG